MDAGWVICIDWRGGVGRVGCWDSPVGRHPVWRVRLRKTKKMRRVEAGPQPWLSRVLAPRVILTTRHSTPHKVGNTRQLPVSDWLLPVLPHSVARTSILICA